jgi:hypothetical protein
VQHSPHFVHGQVHIRAAIIPLHKPVSIAMTKHSALEFGEQTCVALAHSVRLCVRFNFCFHSPIISALLQSYAGIS